MDDGEVAEHNEKSQSTTESLCVEEEWEEMPGRLGAQEVNFLVDETTVDLLIDEMSMRIESTANFATVTANVCVFDGRWMYEVQTPPHRAQTCYPESPTHHCCGAKGNARYSGDPATRLGKARVPIH